VRVLLPLLLLAAPRPQGPATDEVFRSAARSGGIAVHLGCGDGKGTALLAEKGGLLVHALESDPALLAAARAHLEGRKLYGIATVDLHRGPFLPYADDIVNALVAERPGPVTEAEMLRVLVPGGTAWVKGGDSWRTVRKPRPGTHGEWTHPRHGADGNMVSEDTAVSVPAGLRWVAGPPQDEGGRKWYYDHLMVTSGGRNFYVYETAIVARDSYNGRLLWTREVRGYSYKETGAKVTGTSKDAGRAGNRVTKARPAASPDRLYTVDGDRLVALDTATGERAADFGTTQGPRDILLDGGRLILLDQAGVRAWNAGTRSPLWESPLQARRIVAGDGSVFGLSGASVVALDAATGKERWRAEDPKMGEAIACTSHGGFLAVERATWKDDGTGCGVQVFSGKDGRPLWSRDYVPDMTHYQEARSFFIGGLLWLQMKGNHIVAFDPATGREVKKWSSRGKHCSAPVASVRYFIAAECEFTDLETGRQERARMFRAACRNPFVPANGLLNTYPVQCECFPMLRGYMGLGPTLRKFPAEEPLLKPASAPAARPAAGPDEGAWPLYRHDAYRSNSTPAALKSPEPRGAWSAAVARLTSGPLMEEWKGSPFVRGVLTPPVAAGGSVFVAVPFEHRVVSLDAGTGRERWSFTAGGCVDTPPSLEGGLCLFGAHDGRIYALDAGTGQPAWIFRLAPQEGRISAYGQLESPWPVAGSVLVDGGTVYAAAGRHPMADGGIRVAALRARDGQPLWEKTVAELNLKGWYSVTFPDKPKVKIGLDFESFDLLVKDGDQVAMSRWRFNLENGDWKLALDSLEYQAPGLAVPRGLWGYGIRETKAVRPKPPAAFDREKVRTGQAGDVALVLAGGTPVAADAKGELRVGERRLRLEAPPVPDGLIAAYGRLYVSTQDGRVLCLE
jgi:outer membrane protein assembly factor BamB